MRSPTDPHIGATFGNFIIRKRLGAGGMGAVYLGHNPTTRQDVAVKVLKPIEGEHTRQFQERFLREIQVAARIHNEHVVRVLDAGLEGRTVYLVMELVRGGSLGDHLDRAGRLSVEECRRIGLGITRGLHAIHKQGIIHRDIKPDNVLLSGGEQAKLTDLGLARESSDNEDFKRLTATGTVIGTPYYIAPEAIRDSREAGPAADIYSLGATLYHCLAGTPPFDGPSAYEVMRRHLEDRPKPLRQIDRTIPKALADLISSCMDKNPEARPSAGTVCLALECGDKPPQEKRGIGFVATVLIGVLGTSAVIGWQLLARPERTGFQTQQSQDDAVLQLTTSHPGHTRLRVNGDTWAPLAEDTIYLPPGRHLLQAEADEDGALMRWHREVTVETHEQRTLAITLERSLLSRPLTLAIEAPMGACIFRGGRNLGPAPRLTFDTIGTWDVCHWDGVLCAQRAVVIHHDGTLDAGSWEATRWPSGNAYFQGWHHGTETLPHHLVTWWEVEQARKHENLVSNPRWQALSARDVDLAVEIPIEFVKAWQRWRQGHNVRLPDQGEAEVLGRIYPQGLWYSQGAALAYSGSSPEAALLIALER